MAIVVVVAVAAAAVHPAPPPPPPLPSARQTVAWLAHLAWTIGICLLLTNMWLLVCAMTTKDIGRLACGEGCAVVTAAYVVAYAAEITLVLLLPFGLLAEWMRARARAPAAVPPAVAAATDIEATQEHALKTFVAAIWGKLRDALRDPVILGFLAAVAFCLLALFGAMLKAGLRVMGSRRERMGSVMNYVGAFGVDVVGFFVLCPILTVRIWRKMLHPL